MVGSGTGDPMIALIVDGLVWLGPIVIDTVILPVTATHDLLVER